jgi:hypothetical protein
MITNYITYIKEKFNSNEEIVNYIINNFQTQYTIHIYLSHYKYTMTIDYIFLDEDVDYLEKQTGEIYDYNEETEKLDYYINNYLKNSLKIDFKKDELNEKLFLYLKIKFEKEKDNLDNYINISIIENTIYMYKHCTLKDIFEDLKQVFNINEYNNIEKFIEDNINSLINNKELNKLLEYCNDNFRKKYQYIINANKFDLI